jgi:hypothetical protein
MDPEIISIDVFGVNKVFAAMTTNTRRGSRKWSPANEPSDRSDHCEGEERSSEACSIARTAIVYKSSIAYAIQGIRPSVVATDSLNDRELTTSEIQAFQQFSGMIIHFSNIFSRLSETCLTSVLNWTSFHMHNYTDGLRQTLIDICEKLSFDPAVVVPCDEAQDSVNKPADLRVALISARECTIMGRNPLDIQQWINVRL